MLADSLVLCPAFEAECRTALQWTRLYLCAYVRVLSWNVLKIKIKLPVSSEVTINCMIDIRVMNT